MPNIKKLKNIKPFNKFLLMSCYYHQLVSAYSQYGVDERFLIMNYVPLYDRIDWKNHIGIKLLSDKEMEDATGIRVIKKRNVCDIENELINAVNSGVPVLVSIDCYYLPFREDTYKKMSFWHVLLVYGYNKAKREFIINEHSYQNSIFYTERTIAFDDLKAAYEGYKKTFDMSGGVVKVKKIADTKFDFLPLFKKAYIENKDRIKESIDELISFCDNILAVVLDKIRLNRESKKLIEILGYIRNKKQVQKYQMAELMADENINELNNKSMSNLMFVSALLEKTRLTNLYNEKSIAKLTDRLNEIKEIEQKIHELLLRKYDETFC